MQQIEVEVDDGQAAITKRFSGCRLLRYELQKGPRVLEFRVYATARGQFAVYIRDDPDWSRLASAGGGGAVWDDPDTWSGSWWRTTGRTLRVFPDAVAMRDELPDEVVDAVHRALAHPEPEDLDI